MLHAVRHLVEVRGGQSEPRSTRDARSASGCQPRARARQSAPRKRVGRGHGSGTGKTSGRGHKGAGSRSGSSRGPPSKGQVPIHMRMRKLRGPNMKKSMPFEPFRTHTQPVNIADLEARFDAGTEVTLELMKANGLATPQGIPVKVLAKASSQGADRSRSRLLAPPPASASRPRAAPATPSRASADRRRGGARPERIHLNCRPAGARRPRELKPMLSTILNAFQVADIRKKLGFTALMLLIYRIGSHVPVPGVNIKAVHSIQSQLGGNGILGLLNTFSGGGLSRIALFALGIMPYITASIILQLLQVVVPSLEKLSKEGEVGQARITQYTRYLTVGLAFAQSIGYVFLFHSLTAKAGESVVTHFDASHVFLIVVCLTTGCVLLMWIGELITQRGIGNGISLLIFASIVSRLPSGIQQWWTTQDQVFKVMMPFLVLAVVAGIVFVQEGQRRIPVQYAKRVIGRRMSEGGQTYLPLRVNMAGVIPVIFAASLMAFPPTVGSYLVENPLGTPSRLLHARIGWHYIVGETVFIVLFTYFYTAVTFNPVDQADNLKKYGGFIPGVRPGRPTAEFLDRILARLTFPGALFLAAVAALPAILFARTHQQFQFGGTSILIVIGVALETMKHLE